MKAKFKRSFIIFLLFGLYGCLSVAKLSNFPKSSNDIDFNKFKREYPFTIPQRTLETTNEYTFKYDYVIDTISFVKKIEKALLKNGYRIINNDLKNGVVFAERGLMLNEWKTISGVYYQFDYKSIETNIYIRCDISQDFTGGWYENRSLEIAYDLKEELDKSDIPITNDQLNNVNIVKLDSIKIFNEITIPEVFKVNIYNKDKPIDFNRDGLNDLVILLQKKKLQMGDTSYLVFYKMNKDSSYSLVKQFNNVFPIYFDIYYIEKPEYNNSKLKSLFYDCYMGMAKPFSVFGIQNDSIFFTKRLRAKESDKIRYLYRFDKQNGDWILDSKSRITKEGYYPIEIREVKLLSEFSYCDE